MRKAIATLAVLAAAILAAPGLYANFTMFDLAKDSMFIVRGEFTSLERTDAGDKLVLHCDEVITGDDLKAGMDVVLEPFERAHADDALGREVIVCFNLMDGKHYFLNHPHGQRSFIFESSDVAPDGLDRNEQALRNFLAINEPHMREIRDELRKRLQFEDAGYMGSFDSELLEDWKAELLNQVSWTGTRAAKDAAKALFEHSLFKDLVTVADLEQVGSIVPSSAPGTIGRAYMLELIRQQDSAHPSLPVLLDMLREETSQACVGKLTNLFLASSKENRETVIGEIGEIVTSVSAPEQARVNALQVFEGLEFTESLPFVREALQMEVESTGKSKEVVRGALKALRTTHDGDNLELLQSTLESDYVSESWELTQRAWVALAMINSDESNEAVFDAWRNEKVRARKDFFRKLLPENKLVREMIIIHRED